MTENTSTVQTVRPPAINIDEHTREVQRLRLALAIMRHEYADLLAAARAAVASAGRGDLDPLFWIHDELSIRGQLPARATRRAARAA
jgi:hypothetical protein